MIQTRSARVPVILAGFSFACLAFFAVPGFAQLETRSVIPAGNEPTAIAVGDFNHDGNPDLAVAAGGAAELQVFLGKGDGTFRPPVIYPEPARPMSVVAADLRHSGNLDLVVASLENTVSVLLGNGDGTFQAAGSYKTTAQTRFVAVGDSNNDHVPDLVIIDSPYVSVMLGNGDGTFRPPIDTQPPYTPFYLGLGDFNRDGKVDLAVDGQTDGVPFVLGIMLGNGDGTFHDGAEYSVDAVGTSAGIATGKFTSRGNLDVAALGSAGIVTIFLGNGDGTFSQGAEYSGSSHSGSWIDAGDLNGDGNVDLVISNLVFEAGVTTFLGNGDGTFQAGTLFKAGSEPSFITTGDFNRDGMLDLVATDYLYNHAIVLLNTGVVDFSPTAPLKFSPLLLGGTSAPQTVLVTNTGNANLAISSMSVKGPFQLDGGTTCGDNVAPGANCTISAVFKPTTIGTHTGTITLVDSASSKPQAIELSGEGTVVSVIPAQLTFSPQKVGTESSPMLVTVTNEGSTDLTFDSITIGGIPADFPETNNCTTQKLGHGATCTVSVRFKPIEAGKQAGTLRINDDGGGLQVVTLQGTGIG